MAQLLRRGKNGGREELSAINHDANCKFPIAFPFYCILLLLLYPYVFLESVRRSLRP